MAQMSNYGVNTNLNGVNGYARIPSKVIYNALLAATTNVTLTVPSAAAIGRALSEDAHVLAVFSYQAASNVFVAIDADATPNATGAFVADPSMLAPSALILTGGEVINFYPLAQAYVTVEFYTVT